LTAAIFCVLFAVLPLTATSLDFITTQLLASAFPRSNAVSA
jgi:hypothetical protein